MKCPLCGSTAIVLELAGVEIDYCPECGGIWLDGGELEMLLGDDAQRVISEFKKKILSKEKKLRCPACNRKMEKVMLKETCLDRCPKGHGIWFDKGELAKVVATGDLHSKVLELLNDMFYNQIKNKGE